MFKTPLIILAITSTLSWSLASSAATTTIGNLSWDDSTDLIIDKVSGIQYAELGLFKGLSYAEVSDAIATTAAYSGFHIATRDDILQFFNAASGAALTTERDKTQYLLTAFDDGVLGFNSGSSAEYVFGIDDPSASKGSMVIFDSSSNTVDLTTGLSKGLIDGYAQSGDSWLVVAKSSVSAVPVPSSTVMFAPALLGFTALRRKKRA